MRGEGGIFFGDYACEDSTIALRHALSMTANGPPGTLWTPGRSPAGARPPCGLGWFIAVPQDETLVRHSGLRNGAYSALHLKVPSRRLTMILLANSDGLRWEIRLDEAVVERSPFAQAPLAAFPR